MEEKLSVLTSNKYAIRFKSKNTGREYEWNILRCTHSTYCPNWWYKILHFLCIYFERRQYMTVEEYTELSETKLGKWMSLK